MIENDNKFVIETLKGKIDSFGVLVEKYQNIMYNLACQIVHNSDDAKDITQSAFIKAYTKLKSFDSKKSFFSWIYRITLNESLNFNKQAQLTKLIDYDIPGKDKSALEEIEMSEEYLTIKKAISQLEDKYKCLIILKHFHNLSYEEITQIIQIPIEKVKSRLYIAREKLRLSLGEKKYGK
ncbi:MAG: sigma-70 family RNA polymerase sigma factor [bacterium]